MIGDQSNNQSTIVQGFSLQQNYTIDRILVFVKNELPEFEVIFKESGTEIYKEDDISKELSRYFNDKARDQNLFFQFNEKKGVDFTVYVQPYSLGVGPIFMIEAKRLSNKHRDYVFGKTGGIERIKREQDDFGKHLSHGALIAYVQGENQGFWHNKINRWIQDLIEAKTNIIWQEEDKLIPNNPISDYVSKHSRVSKTKITLNHFWINLN